MRLWTRIKMAVAAFFTILFKGRLPAALQPEARVELPVRPATDDAADRAIQLLALLQREGRLVDIMREDLGSYSDAQIGAAARDVHASCRRVLERYVALEAILAGGEVAALSLVPSLLYVAGAFDIPADSLALRWHDDDSTRRWVVGELARQRGAENPSRLVASAKSWLSHGGVNRTSAILPFGAPDV